MGNCVGCYRFKEDEFEGLFIEFYLVHGYTPSVNTLGKHGLPTSGTIRRRYDMSYNEFLLSLGLPVNKKSTGQKSKEEMLQDLKDIAEELGRVPQASDLTGRHGISGKGTYADRFGSWTNALQQAGFKPVWRPVSDEELIIELRRFYIENGRSPTTRDKLLFGWATFNIRFSGWDNALRTAGLPINSNIYGNRTVGKDGKVYDSISESIIADWLFTNNVSYESHVPYFNKLIADFKVGDIYIEFFGLPKIPEYAAKMNLKRALCRLKGYELIEIMPEDLARLDVKLSKLLEVSA